MTPGLEGKAEVVSLSVHSRSKLRAALNDVLGGSAASVLNVTFCMSYALLIFSGPLTPYLSYGVAVTFISSAIIAAVLAFGSSIPFAVGGPESSTAAMTGILASSLLERIAAHSQASPVVPVLITFGLASIATGIVLYCFGVTRMGARFAMCPIQ